MKQLFTLLLVLACGNNKPSEPVPFAGITQKASLYCELSKQQYTENKFVVDECDSAGFTSLYSLGCSNNNVDLSVFSNESGEMFRNPNKDCYPARSKSGFSKDHVLMRLVAAVGFPVSARNVIGDTSGQAVPSGYIGEIIAQERLSSASLNGTATTVAVNITASPLVLTPGNWLITANVNVDVSSAQVTTWQMSVSKTSATHNTYYGAPVSGEITAKRTLGSGFLYTDNQSVTYPYSVTASTTLYLVASCTFASGTNTQLSGRIQAVRIS